MGIKFDVVGCEYMQGQENAYALGTSIVKGHTPSDFMNLIVVYVLVLGSILIEPKRTIV